MAEPDAKAAQAGAASTTGGSPSPRPPKPANPVWRMMGKAILFYFLRIPDNIPPKKLVPEFAKLQV